MTWEAANCRLAAEKLGTIWHGQVLALVSSTVIVLTSIAAVVVALSGGAGAVGWTLVLALVGLVCALVGGIMCLVGLYGLGPLDGDYRTAFTCQIVNVILTFLGNLLEDGNPLSFLIDLASSVLTLAAMWLILQATGQLLREAGREERNGRGMLAFWLSAAALAATYVISWLLDPLLEPTMMAALLLLPLAVSLAGGVLYILYLRAAARMMAEAAGEGNLFQREE